MCSFLPYKEIAISEVGVIIAESARRVFGDMLALAEANPLTERNIAVINGLRQLITNSDEIGQRMQRSFEIDIENDVISISSGETASTVDISDVETFYDSDNDAESHISSIFSDDGFVDEIFEEGQRFVYEDDDIFVRDDDEPPIFADVPPVNHQMPPPMEEAEFVPDANMDNMVAQCNICMESVMNRRPYTTICGHLFCLSDLIMWFNVLGNTSCPVCRQPATLADCIKLFP